MSSILPVPVPVMHTHIFRPRVGLRVILGCSVVATGRVHSYQMFRFAVVALVLAVASASFRADWAGFKQKYNKNYNGEEEVIRRAIYVENIMKINQHNEKYARGETSYYMGENKFTDMTAAEFSATMKGFRLNMSPDSNLGPEPSVAGLPDTVDWRPKGYVTPVKNQADCGSCWAFSTTGAVEGQHFAKTGKLVSLSESNLVDCSHNGQNAGCAGGYQPPAFEYIIKNGGIDTEESYPYVAMNGTCKYNPANVGATISSYKMIVKRSEKDLQQKVATIGPISVTIDAQSLSFQFYSGGVYDEPACQQDFDDLDHAVLAVGYGTERGKDYWLVKNSWGVDWGIQGYIKMSRNKNNQCGIATYASYPIV